MSGQGFFPHLNFHHAAAKGHLEASAIDIVLSKEFSPQAERTKNQSLRCFEPRQRDWIRPKRKQDWRRLDLTSSPGKAAQALCENCGGGR